MALYQPIEQTTGAVASYWRIIGLNLNWNRQRGSISMVGYKSKDRRDEYPEKGIMDRRDYPISQEMFVEHFEPTPIDQLPEWDAETEYAKGDQVTITDAGGSLVAYVAHTDVPPGEAPPNENANWILKSDIGVNRNVAYAFVKANDPDFSDAQDA